jgi:hypothetical protein
VVLADQRVRPITGTDLAQVALARRRAARLIAVELPVIAEPAQVEDDAADAAALLAQAVLDLLVPVHLSPRVSWTEPAPSLHCVTRRSQEMSRRKKRRRPHHRPLQVERSRQLQDDVVQDTAARFTCSTKTAADFAAQCLSRREDLDCDIIFNRLAHEIWVGRPGRAEELAAALADLLAERHRHDAALAALGQRFRALAQEERHEHLAPPEDYRALVRQRVFEDPLPPPPA